MCWFEEFDVMCWFEEFDVNVLVSHLLRFYRHVTNVKLKFGVTIHPKHGNKYIRL